MDYRAIAELIWFSFLGLSVFALVVGFSIRAFLAPVVREAMDRLGQTRTDDQARSDVRLEYLESRLIDMETQLHRLTAADDFQRQLRGGAEGAPPPPAHERSE